MKRSLFQKFRMARSKKFSISNSTAISIILVFVLLGVGLSAAIILNGGNGNTTTSSSSTTSTTQNIGGIVTGYVTVGPSQPVCSENQSCTVDLTGYLLEFTLQCSGTSSSFSYSTSCSGPVYKATISPSGHYSILLPAGTYSMIGLSPSCSWMGCPSTFPKTVVVQGGLQLVVNVDIDTGIR